MPSETMWQDGWLGSGKSPLCSGASQFAAGYAAVQLSIDTRLQNPFCESTIVRNGRRAHKNSFLLDYRKSMRITQGFSRLRGKTLCLG